MPFALKLETMRQGPARQGAGADFSGSSCSSCCEHRLRARSQRGRYPSLRMQVDRDSREVRRGSSPRREVRRLRSRPLPPNQSLLRRHLHRHTRGFHGLRRLASHVPPARCLRGRVRHDLRRRSVALRRAAPCSRSAGKAAPTARAIPATATINHCGRRCGPQPHAVQRASPPPALAACAARPGREGKPARRRSRAPAWGGTPTRGGTLDQQGSDPVRWRAGGSVRVCGG